MMLAALLGAAAQCSAAPSPRLLLGPTANHRSITDETLQFLRPGNDTAWAEVRGLVDRSGGGLHLRGGIFHPPYCEAGQGCARAQKELAAQAQRLGLRVSVEAGEGALCGAGSGEAKAKADLLGLSDFVAAGGHVTFFEVTSTFSRSHACKGPDNETAQPLSVTAREAAAYAHAMAAVLQPDHIYLYDALPHYSVGKAWPANVQGYNLELGEVLTAFKAAMMERGLTLAGYWMDCPYDYSIAYPAVSGGKSGFEKIAAAVKLVKSMGLLVGKTFNYQKGGGAKATPTDPSPGSDLAFYNGTMSDYARTMAVVPSAASGGEALDFVMVESWYRHPTELLPETAEYTMAYTARAVLRQTAGPD